MSVFRNLGVIAFLTMLVTSAFWFAQGLAIAFAVLCLVAFSYPLVDRFRDRVFEHIPFFRSSKGTVFDTWSSF